MQEIDKTFDIKSTLDEIYQKLCNKAQPLVYRNFPSMCCDYDNIYDKVSVLLRVVTDNWGCDSKNETASLKAQLQSLEKEKESLKNIAVKYEMEIKAMKDKVQAQEYKIQKYSEMISEQQKKIQEQQTEIATLQQKLAKHTIPKTKKGNKNAYKADVDSVQVFRDIASGMSITKAAIKYNISRETVKKRYKEGKQICEG